MNTEIKNELSASASGVGRLWLALSAAPFALMVCTLSVRCQTTIPAWVQHYDGPGRGDDFAWGIAVDVTGKSFVTGYSIGADGSYEYATIAYSATGAPLWTNRYSDPPFDAKAYAIALDGSGNVFVTGSSGTVAYSKSGAPLWTNGGVFGNALAVDSQGNVIVTGFYFGDYMTIKYSGAGVLLWTNRYNGPGNATDIAESVAVDGSDNVFVTGVSQGSLSGNDYATIKYSAAGVPLWTNRYSGPGNGEDHAYAVAVDTNGNAYVTGTSYDGSSSGFLTIQYSGAGVPLWTNRYNGPGPSGRASAVAVDGNGNVVVTGLSAASSGSSDFVTIKYSGSGTGLWTNRYDGPGHSNDYSYSMAIDANGNVFVAGASFGDGTGTDFATLKYSSSGLALWTNRYNGPTNSSDWPVRHCLALGPDGSVFVTGGSGNLPDDGTYDYSYDFVTIKYVEVWPITLGPLTLTNGVFTASFTNTPGAPFTLLATTNLSLPPSNWSVLGGIAETSPGQFTFTDPQTTNTAQRFYSVRSL